MRPNSCAKGCNVVQPIIPMHQMQDTFSTLALVHFEIVSTWHNDCLSRLKLKQTSCNFAFLAHECVHLPCGCQACPMQR